MKRQKIKEWSKKKINWVWGIHLSISNGGYFHTLLTRYPFLSFWAQNVLPFGFFPLTPFHFLFLPLSIFASGFPISLLSITMAVAMASWTSGLHSNRSSWTLKSSEPRFANGVFTKGSIAFQTKCFCLLQSRRYGCVFLLNFFIPFSISWRLLWFLSVWNMCIWVSSWI